jgi:hypothetical protein
MQIFRDGELLERFESPVTTAYAERLARRFFPKTESLGVWSEIVSLYKALLVLAPVMQRQRHIFKIDMHRGHVLTMIGRVANKRGRKFHISYRKESRVLDEGRLRRNLESLSVMDTIFIETVLIDLFRTNYAQECARGRLANVLFDWIMFFGKGDGSHIRIGNSFLRLEQEAHDGSVDIREEDALVWDYRIRYLTVDDIGHINILLSEDCMKSFRDQIKAILRANASPAYKIILIENAIRGFVDAARFARAALLQILEMKRWLQQKLRRLSGTEKNARILPEKLLKLFQERLARSYYSNKPNFFWDPNRVPEDIFMNFFSPYREW